MNHVTTSAKEDVSAVLDRNAGPVFQRLSQIALGRKIRLGVGPNATTAYPSETSQMKALEILARKLRPDLAAQQLTGADDKPLFSEEAKPRDLARTVLDIFRQAEEEQSGEPQGLPAPSAVGHDDDSTTRDTGPGDAPDEPEGREVFDNGATIELTEIVPARMQPGANGSQREAPAIRKWHVFDASGALHGCRVRREDAVALAESLPRVPGGSGAW